MKLDLSLKTQVELRDEVEDYLNDSTNTLATPAQYYTAINRALNLWTRRVVVPHIYTFSFVWNTYDYSLPSYVRRPFQVFIQSSYSNPDTVTQWDELIAYSAVPNGTGGYTLRCHVTPTNGNGSIVWYQENGPFPTGAVTVSTTINTTATSLICVVSGSPHVNDSGWIKIEDEWIAYSGITRTSATSYTLTNLRRAQYGTVAASHASTTAVYWGIAADDERLWQQLYDRAGSYIHFLNLQKSTTEDSSRHEKLYGEMKANANNFWTLEGYVTQRKPRIVPSHMALGAAAWML